MELEKALRLINPATRDAALKAYGGDCRLANEALQEARRVVLELLEMPGDTHRMTNGDMLRAMSDDELAEWFYQHEIYGNKLAGHNWCNHCRWPDCGSCTADWLKMENADNPKTEYMEAWANLAQRLAVYAHDHGYTQDDLRYEIIVFEALRKMEERKGE